MKMNRLVVALVAALGFGGTAGQAALLDFTDGANFSDSGTIDGVGYTLTAFGGPITFNGGTGPGAIGPLVGFGDGIGIGNDEIDQIEAIRITFTFPVKVEAFYMLDFFASPGDAETAVVTSKSNVVANLVATAPVGGPGFGAFFAETDYAAFATKSLLIPAGIGNDDVGVGDFALAGLELTAIPVPASAGLLGSVLLGGYLVHRRRRRPHG